MKDQQTAAASSSEPAISAEFVSFYRHCVRQCESAAQNAQNEQMRSELSRMVDVWREFAAEHERMLRQGKNFDVRRNHALKGWM